MAFNIYEEVVRAACQSRLTDERRKRLPTTLKAMQKRNLSAGKVKWADFLNEVQSVSIRPSLIFFLYNREIWNQVENYSKQDKRQKAIQFNGSSLKKHTFV